ncbi:MAG: radical SAM protein [Candidatus Hydrogenedentota bacterium]|nr:MAG: radical SAM protein [Candidatus Hydrogenedentota bacterium]
MSEENPMIVVVVGTLVGFQGRFLRSPDLDPEVRLGERLLQGLRAVGFDRILLVGMLSRSAAFSSEEREGFEAEFRRLGEMALEARCFDVGESLHDRKKAVRKMWEYVLEKTGEEKIVVRLRTSSVCLGRDDILRLARLRNPACLMTRWNGFRWEFGMGMTRKATERYLATGRYPEEAEQEVIEREDRFGENPLPVGFGFRSEYTAFLKELPGNGLLTVEELFSTARRFPELLRPYPRHIGIEVTTRDNLPRLRRPAVLTNRGEVDMTPETFAAVLEEYPPPATAFFSMDFWDFGEPLLNENTIDWIRAATERGIRTDLYTNGTLLNEAVVEGLFDAGVDAVFVRMDAVTKETYERVNGNGERFPLMVRNVEILMRKKAEMVTKLQNPLPPPFPPYVVLQITEMPETAGDFEAFFKRFDLRQKIRDRIRDEEGRAASADEVTRRLYESEAIVDFTMLRHDNLFCGKVVRNGGMDVTPLKRFRCRQIDSGLYVLAGGEVVFCREDVDGNEPLGTAGEGIVTLWRSERCRRFLALHDEGRWDEIPLCRECREWFYSFE